MMKQEIKSADIDICAALCIFHCSCSGVSSKTPLEGRGCSGTKQMGTVIAGDADSAAFGANINLYVYNPMCLCVCVCVVGLSE